MNILQEKIQTKKLVLIIDELPFLAETESFNDIWRRFPLRFHWRKYKNNLLTEGTFLNDEPQTLLRIELREPSVYNSILEAISNGCNKIREIADRIYEEKSKCSKYMLTLQTSAIN